VRTTSPGLRVVRPLPASVPVSVSFMLAGHRVTAADLAALPADPVALRTRILAAGTVESEAGTLFNAGRDLVASLPVSAQVRAAARRMLADLPGVDFLGTVQDRHGRSGLAVAYTRRGDGGVGQQRLVIDAATGHALAVESWHLAGPGGDTLMSWTVQLCDGYTDDAPPGV
jgi:hypothetical protein